jgi:hypothetical protein
MMKSKQKRQRIGVRTGLGHGLKKEHPTCCGSQKGEAMGAEAETPEKPGKTKNTGRGDSLRSLSTNLSQWFTQNGISSPNENLLEQTDADESERS